MVDAGRRVRAGRDRRDALRDRVHVGEGEALRRATRSGSGQDVPAYELVDPVVGHVVLEDAGATVRGDVPAAVHVVGATVSGPGADGLLRRELRPLVGGAEILSDPQVGLGEPAGRSVDPAGDRERGQVVQTRVGRLLLDPGHQAPDREDVGAFQLLGRGDQTYVGGRVHDHLGPAGQGEPVAAQPQSFEVDVPGDHVQGPLRADGNADPFGEPPGGVGVVPPPDQAGGPGAPGQERGHQMSAQVAGGPGEQDVGRRFQDPGPSGGGEPGVQEVARGRHRVRYRCGGGCLGLRRHGATEGGDDLLGRVVRQPRPRVHEVDHQPPLDDSGGQTEPMQRIGARAARRPRVLGRHRPAQGRLVGQGEGAQEVEADLGAGARGVHRPFRGLAESALGLLDRLGGRADAVHGHVFDRREPADGVHVGVAPVRGVPAVGLHLHGECLAPVPCGDGVGERRQQEGLQPLGASVPVEEPVGGLGVEGPGEGGRLGPGQGLGAARRVGGGRRRRRGPPVEVGGRRWEGRVPGERGAVGVGQVVEQDPPGEAVHRQMVRGQREPVPDPVPAGEEVDTEREAGRRVQGVLEFGAGGLDPLRRVFGVAGEPGEGHRVQVLDLPGRPRTVRADRPAQGDVTGQDRAHRPDQGRGGHRYPALQEDRLIPVARLPCLLSEEPPLCGSEGERVGGVPFGSGGDAFPGHGSCDRRQEQGRRGAVEVLEGDPVSVTP